ncbi:hypothetical protein BM1_04407 [Bipolaris maydis]|uniref:uncharacterized protein n=1 Tax=Cochliobolus heterostrophus TaxID=5016 RepID=UPI0024DBB413|nr:hypothetical protein BM1_04407 [Bipolaris maydis]KAJ5027184.1 hypothetical protein J3E73DRAFT_409891 [Bipolaris maydis]KAJ5059045.1 hypothetical protein J3E74DRAFT_419628 [Bipolaris maydis]KAJ6270915.1 hypothetical protein PSV08DRAFT_362423 [Bipolaris maydis]KAJ6278267.1 hypothetical protein J3E71DRAFT_370974 [Bipolaris maydis]
MYLRAASICFPPTIDGDPDGCPTTHRASSSQETPIPSRRPHTLPPDFSAALDIVKLELASGLGRDRADPRLQPTAWLHPYLSQNMSERGDVTAQAAERAGTGTPPVDDGAADAQAGQNSKKRKNGKEPEANKKPKVIENKAIWISNLPPDTTAKEIEDEFSRFGIIDKGADGQPRIKMYMDDETGKFTGNAMVVYFRKEAITNAVNMMDDYVLRPGDYSNGTIRVEPAKIEHKKERDGDKIASKLTRKDRKASERNRAELNRKLNEWSDNEEEVAEAFAPKKNKWAKVVIIKHAFTPAELDEEPEAYLEIKEEMREAAEEYGEVTNCTLYDKEPEGIVTVRFREFEPAEKFMADYQGRGYQRRKLALSLAEDKPRFKKSARGDEPDSDEGEADRVASTAGG